MFLTECKQAVIYTTEDIFLCDAAVSHISEESTSYRNQEQFHSYNSFYITF